MNDYIEPECPGDVSNVFTDDLDDHLEMPDDIKMEIKGVMPLPATLRLLTHERPKPILRRVK